MPVKKIIKKPLKATKKIVRGVAKTAVKGVTKVGKVLKSKKIKKPKLLAGVKVSKPKLKKASAPKIAKPKTLKPKKKVVKATKPKTLKPKKKAVKATTPKTLKTKKKAIKTAIKKVLKTKKKTVKATKPKVLKTKKTANIYNQIDTPEFYKSIIKLLMQIDCQKTDIKPVPKTEIPKEYTNNDELYYVFLSGTKIFMIIKSKNNKSYEYSVRVFNSGNRTDVIEGNLVKPLFEAIKAETILRQIELQKWLDSKEFLRR